MSTALHCTKLHHCTTVSTGFYHFYISLVGGFNPFEKYLSKWESSPNRGEKKCNHHLVYIYMTHYFWNFQFLSAGKAAYPFGARRDMPIKKSSCAKVLNMPNRIICPNKPQARYWIFSNSKDKKDMKQLPPKKLKRQWKLHHLKMYFLLKMGSFQCHVSFHGCMFVSCCTQTCHIIAFSNSVRQPKNISPPPLSGGMHGQTWQQKMQRSKFRVPTCVNITTTYGYQHCINKPSYITYETKYLAPVYLPVISEKPSDSRSATLRWCDEELPPPGWEAAVGMRPGMTSCFFCRVQTVWPDTKQNLEKDRFKKGTSPACLHCNFGFIF